MATSGIPLLLSNTTPDVDSLILQMQLYVSSKQSWKDLIASGTGQTLIELMASVGCFNQFAIESAARECFLTTAARDSSVYAITRMLGVRINRKSPAHVEVSITRPSSRIGTLEVIPKFSQWTVNGVKFFNRENISFQIGKVSPVIYGKDSSGALVELPTTLYEGEVRQQILQSDTSTFREIYLEEPGFVVSNEDVRVVVVSKTGDRVAWTPLQEGQGIWMSGPGDNKYYNSTSGFGDAILAFGDGFHGAVPPPVCNIEVTYAVTNGAASNTGMSNLEVKYLQDATIFGTTSSITSGGSDEKPASFYRAMAPFIFKARSRAVTKQDYQAIILHYPGIASASIIAQRDDNMRLKTPQFMNVVEICVLPNKPPVGSNIPADQDYFLSVHEWSDLLAYLDSYKHAAIYIKTRDPYRIEVDVTMTIVLKSTASPASVKSVIEENVTNLFARNYDTLGRRIAISDLINAASITGVDYVDILQPTSDVIPINHSITADDGTSDYIKQVTAFLELRSLQLSFVYSERS